MYRFSKFYEKLKTFIIENYVSLLLYLVLIVTLTYKLPFYIYTGGGIIDATSRINIEDKTSSKGTFNFAYVSSLYATIPTYLLAQFIPDWKIESISSYQYSEEESEEEIFLRDKLFLEEANTSAIFVAYNKAGKTININEVNLYVTYINDRTTTNLKIGDIIKKINGQEVDSLDSIKNIVDYEKTEQLEIEVLRDGKKVNCYAKIYEEEDRKIIGISVLRTYKYDTIPNIEINFKRTEAGPSGGLTLALTIYDALVDTDMTNGKKIVGTGTIDMDGNVGEIGGVIYKLQGAINNKADVFIVPNGNNYRDVKKECERKKCNVEIVGVDTFDDAISYLEEMR